MGYQIDYEAMDRILEQLAKDYQIFAPKWDRQKKNVRYGIIRSIAEVVTGRQTDFSIKEAFYPISQVMLYFRADNVEEEELKDPRKILILCRPCDINSIRRLDKIFLENGAPDYFYARLREKVVFALLECRKSFEDCFCVSMQSNITGDYAFALRLDNRDGITAAPILVQVADAAFEEYFAGAEAADFQPEFVTENKKIMHAPEISRADLKEISDLEYWKQFDDRCIGCGGCNTVCGTCSCFDTSDVLYAEGKSDGERRRVWSSCMIPTFTETAGGVRARKTPGANMRFKVFHKFYDFRARFGEDSMCVGCGRCDMRCPKDISFFDTVNGLTEEIRKMKTGGEPESK